MIPQMMTIAMLFVAADKPKPAPVHVEKVSAEIVLATFLGHEGEPAQTYMIVKATGFARGTKNARLVERYEGSGHIKPAKDGYLEFDLVVDRSDGPAVQVDIAKIGQIEIIPGMLKGVRVYGADSVAESTVTGVPH